jgi:hypothetical protein
MNSLQHTNDGTTNRNAHRQIQQKSTKNSRLASPHAQEAPFRTPELLFNPKI